MNAPELLDRLVDLVERCSLAEVEYADGTTRIRLVKDAARDDTEPATKTGAVVPASVAAASVAAAPPPPASKLHRLEASMVGTFFSRPSPDAAPFVKAGDRVEAGQVVGVIEAMKMLNEVEADRAGRVVELLVGDAAMVAAGTPLLVIEADVEHV